jgi:hypothetical protein
MIAHHLIGECPSVVSTAIWHGAATQELGLQPRNFDRVPTQLANILTISELQRLILRCAASGLVRPHIFILWRLLSLLFALRCRGVGRELILISNSIYLTNIRITSRKGTKPQRDRFSISSVRKSEKNRSSCVWWLGMSDFWSCEKQHISILWRFLVCLLRCADVALTGSRFSSQTVLPTYLNRLEGKNAYI